ncbi:MAG: ankyrin repeat domain-containing protein [Cyanobacteria bacterium P01_G01_bin.39]
MSNNLNNAINNIFNHFDGDYNTTEEDSQAVFNELSEAVKKGDKKFFHQLVAAEKAKERKKNEPTILFGAVSAGKIDIVKALIEAGCDVNAKIEMCFTFDALGVAVDKGFTEIVQVLLDSGADPNANNANPGIAYIRKAMRKGYTKIVHLLLDRGAKVKFGTGFRLLVDAAENSNVEIVQMIIDAGCNVNTRNYQYDTSLTAACRRGKVEVVKTLVDAGANVNKTGMHEYTPIISVFYAEITNKFMARQGFTKAINNIEESVYAIVDILINAGAEVNCRDSHHGTIPLMMAIIKNYHSVAKLLIEAGADLDLISQPDPNSFFVGEVKNRTALHIAVELEQINTVRMLLEAGANSQIQNSDNQTPLDVAIVKNQTKIAELLKNYS